MAYSSDENYPTLQNALFGAVILTKNAKYKYIYIFANDGSQNMFAYYPTVYMLELKKRQGDKLWS